MLKNFLLSIFALALVLTTVGIAGLNIASARTLQEAGITAEDAKLLSPADLDAILNPSQELLDLEAAVRAANAINTEDGLLPNTVNCFDYYKFGSVQAEFSALIKTAVAGTPITFSGQVHNANSYPIVQGKLIIKIFKASATGAKDINGPDIVDEFTALTDATIAANGSVPLTFDWKIPAHLESGNYKAVAFFTVADKFNLLGLTFTDDIIGNSANFTVAGSKEVVRFNKSEVTINGNSYYFAAYPPRISKDIDAVIEVQLVNTTAVAQNISVVWKAYAWDAQGPGNLLSEHTETITVGAKSNAKAKYTISNTEHPVYYVVAEAKYLDTKSIIGMRFVRNGIYKARINFPSVLSYPLVKGGEAKIFSCMHVMSDIPVNDGRLLLTLKSPGGKTLHSYEYKGVVTGAMMGIADTFIPEKNLNDFTLKAELFQGTTLVDSAEMKYDCKKLDPDNCSNAQTTVLIFAALAAIIVIILISIMRKKRMPTGISGTTAMLFLIAIGAGALLAPNVASAKEAQWNSVLTENIRTSFGPFKTTLRRVNVTVTYSAEVSKQTGEVLSGGESLPVGTALNLKFIPHTSNDIYWFGTGGVDDSPYGEWRAGAVAPAISCQEKDFTNADIHISAGVNSMRWAYLFFPLVLEAPNKNLQNLQNLSCGALNASGVASCTVTAAGPVSASFKYDETFGNFYFRYKTHPFTGRQKELSELGDYECKGTNSSLHRLTVPAQTITYTFSGSAEANQPPTTPVITGPVTGRPGDTYTFGLLSTDPDGDDIKYGMDWLNGTTVNQWAPSTGFIAQNNSQSVTKSWSVPGTYTFKAMAQDDNGAVSGWAAHTIVISEDSDTPIIPIITGSGCTPGAANCSNSCGSFPPIATGFGLNINSPNLCVQANPPVIVSGFTGSPALAGWTWGCQGSWQSIPQRCSAVCASGYYSSVSGKCVTSPDDYCPNISGNQTNSGQYDLDNDGNCLPRASVLYFKFDPDIAETNCSGYWDTVLPSADLGFTTTCAIDGDTVIGGHTVGTSNPQPPSSLGKSWFLRSAGRLHTLTCTIRDSLGIARGTANGRPLEASARCYRIGELQEI
jgi:hypothetical protein